MTKLHSSFRRGAAQTALRGLIAAAVASTTAQAADFTDTKSYLTPVSTDYVVQPLLSVGDRVPNTSNASGQYQMIGIPDGLGAFRNGNQTILFMNHELPQNTTSEPNIGGPLQRGAFVSRFVLDQNAGVLSGEIAYDVVVDEERKQRLPRPEVGNNTPGFARFCSGSVAFREAGFDRPIYFAGEESGSPNTFDGKGGLNCAIFDRELHTLPKMGRFPWENALVRPDPNFRTRNSAAQGRGPTAPTTVVMLMEDGPTTPDNQLYMYVGPKDTSSGASVLSRNGLDTGKLYAFESTTSGQTSELTFTSGSITGRWRELPDATSLTDRQLEEASDAVNAFGFIRIEDGAWSKTDSNSYYFVTTGNGPGNRLGRMYQVRFDPRNILGATTISMIYNGDAVDAAGGDIAFAPDNMDVSREVAMINEDGHSDSRPEYGARARDGSIWRLDLRTFAPKRVAELNPPGTAIAPGQTAPPAVGPGVWETSGIIDASEFFGKDSWLTVVQAHGPSLAPAPNTVEDGQLVLMLPARR